MTQVRYRDLTPEQKSIMCDGCGTKGGWIPVPQWIFTASCDIHDFNYWLGYREEDREKADRQFYEAMVSDANTYGFIKKTFYKSQAWLYYKAVRLLGAKHFTYSDHEQTYEDMLAYMEQHKK